MLRGGAKQRAGGASGDLQYSSAGALAGISGSDWDGSILTLPAVDIVASVVGDLHVSGSIYIGTDIYSALGTPGQTGNVTLAKITGGGFTGLMGFENGIITTLLPPS